MYDLYVIYNSIERYVPLTICQGHIFFAAYSKRYILVIVMSRLANIRAPPRPLSVFKKIQKGAFFMQESYFIYVNGVRIPVSEDVYHDIKRAEWREKRQALRRDGELSFDRLLEDGVLFPDDGKLVEEIVEDKLLLEMLNVALSELPDDEQQLINALFYQNQSELTFAMQHDMSQQAVSKRKAKILEKLRRRIVFFKKF